MIARSTAEIPGEQVPPQNVSIAFSTDMAGLISGNFNFERRPKEISCLVSGRETSFLTWASLFELCVTTAEISLAQT